MGKLTPIKRKKIEALVVSVMDGLDPSGLNSKAYKEKFKKMSDKDMENLLHSFKTDDDANFRLTIIPYKNDIVMNDIKKTAAKMGVPLFERVAMPFVNPDGEVYWTSEKVPVGYVHHKRTQQTVSKKNSMSINIDKRNPVSGQVTQDSKNARMSDMENIALVTLDNAQNIIKEFLGPRSDNMKAKYEMFNVIKNEGRVAMTDININKGDSVALNSLDVYFTACGLKTDLITDGLMLKKTLKDLNKDMSSSYSGKR